MLPTDEKTDNTGPFLSSEFNFEAWKQLHQDNPDSFETMRSQLINDFIQSAPAHYQRRLEGIMFQVNAIRVKSKSPVQSCVEISKMMQNSLGDLRGFIDELNYNVDEKTSVPANTKLSATILDFSR